VQDRSSNCGCKDRTKSQKSSSSTNQKGSSDFTNIFTNFIRDAFWSNLKVVGEGPTLASSIVDDDNFFPFECFSIRIFLASYQMIPHPSCSNQIFDGGVVQDRHRDFRAIDGIMSKTFKEISD